MAEASDRIDSKLPWIFDGVPLAEPPEGAIGFIYRVTDTRTGKKYIGKKLFNFRRTKTIAGKKKKVTIASDWLSYYGSNKTLQEEIKVGGVEYFHREIIKLCYSKTECNYEETRCIIEERALFRDDYYNDWVTFKVTRKHIESATKKNEF